MKEIILIVCIIVFGGLGYFVMGRVDKFLDKNYKKDEKLQLKPKTKILDNDLTENEIINEIKEFKKENPNGKIILYEEDL